MTIKQTKWIKDGKITNVWIKSTKYRRMDRDKRL